MKNKCVNLAVFVSGSGSNAENLVNYFTHNNDVCVKLILTNNPRAGVMDRMKKYNREAIVFNKEDFYQKDIVLDLLRHAEIDIIVLAGFLWLVPEKIIDSFENRIVNIHPALLPAYGGKGMYGHHIHKKVVENKEPMTGITVHLVNKEYDKGQILFQATCPVSEYDTDASVAEKVHQLEYLYYPQIILSFINSSKQI